MMDMDMVDTNMVDTDMVDINMEDKVNLLLFRSYLLIILIRCLKGLSVDSKKSK